ncbi:MAG: hypothetical protein WD381_07710, partial [Balneolaceae bacterium]
MALSSKNRRLSEIDYRNRFLLSILVAQILVLMTFKFWPEEKREINVYNVEPPERQVLLDEIEITQQRSSPPPPPKPIIPQPVPSDEVIDYELDIDELDDLPEMPDLDPGDGSGVDGDEARIVGSPQIPPTVIRIVEATTPDEVPPELRGNLEMIVNFLVDENGDVEEASIMEIRKYSNDGEYEILPYVQYGLMDAVLKAALQWRFRPARQDGENVKAFTR